jgi:ABC-type lipoprotein release transport system permease subunit
MSIIFSISWKNIWRNKLRSFALLMAIFLGVSCGLIMAGLASGMVNQRFKSLIEKQISHIQIHSPGFMQERESALYLQDENFLRKSIDTISTLQAYTFRTLSNGMLASGHNTTGVNIIGVNTKEEKIITGFEQNILEGSFFESDRTNTIIISQKTARKLQVKIGGRLVLSFQDLNGDITSGAFRVEGIFRTSNSGYDETHVFVESSDLQSLLGHTVYHQVAILLDNYEDAPYMATKLSGELGEYDIQSWSGLSPELRILLEQGNFSVFIFMIIILIGLAFGILNTMLMAVFERTRELGMLLSVGMTKGRVFSMIVLETVFLSLIGGMGGIGCGWILISVFEQKGINLSGFSDALAEFGYEAIIYPEISSVALVGITALVLLTAVLASLFPAFKALSLNPAEAVRK